MKFNIGDAFLQEYKTVDIKKLDEIDDGEAEEIRCCWQLSKLNWDELPVVANKLKKKLAIDGKLTIEDMDYWRVTHNYYWDKISIQDVNNALKACNCLIESEVVRELFPELKIIRSKIDGHRFLVEFQRENNV